MSKNAFSLDEFEKSFLAHIENPTDGAFNPSHELDNLAREVIESRKDAPKQSVGDWARTLAADLSEFSD